MKTYCMGTGQMMMMARSQIKYPMAAKQNHQVCEYRYVPAS